MSNLPHSVKPPLPTLKRTQSGTRPRAVAARPANLLRTLDKIEVVRANALSGKAAPTVPRPDGLGSSPRPAAVVVKSDADVWERGGTMVGGRRYRDSFPTVPTPEVLEQRLVEEFERAEHQLGVEPVATVEVEGGPADPAIELDKAAAVIDDPFQLIAQEDVAATAMSDLDIEVDVAADLAPPVATCEPSIVVGDACEASEVDELCPASELNRESRTCETVPSARSRVRRRRRLVPRLLMLALLFGALVAGYRYDPAPYQWAFSELKVRVAQGQRVAQQTWLDGRRWLGF